MLLCMGEKIVVSSSDLVTIVQFDAANLGYIRMDLSFRRLGFKIEGLSFSPYGRCCG